MEDMKVTNNVSKISLDEKQPNNLERSEHSLETPDQLLIKENGKRNGHKSQAHDKAIPAELKKKIAQTKKLKNGEPDCQKEEKKLAVICAIETNASNIDIDVDILIHVFDDFETTELKLEALARKYVLLASDHRSTEIRLDDMNKQYTSISKNRDFIQLENQKMANAKSKLECLCRELQKQNKEIKNDSNRRASEEDQKRRELSEKFQVTINEISTQVTENHQTNQQLRVDNDELTKKLKGLLDQYELREKHIEKVLKAKELELQLCETKLQQQVLQSQQDKETNLQEKQLILQDAIEQKKRCELLMKQEIELKGQLEFYTSKFEEFQSTLTKSNDVFATFQKEMGKMTKQIKKLEKESLSWKTRFENTNRSLLQMVDEKVTRDQELVNLKNKIEKLENLCRVLQNERNSLRKQIVPDQPQPQVNEVKPTEVPQEEKEETTEVSNETKVDDEKAT